MKNYPAWDPTVDARIFDRFVQSRRGYDPDRTLGNGADLHSNYPTRIANPFRSALAGDMMPAVADLRKTGVEVSLLRNAPGSPEPLFAPIPAGPNQPVHANAARNPFFRYQGLTRLGNLVSTNSNVFAVWITVGFFELELNQGTGVVDRAHPDGYALGRELGSDQAQVKRHRSFYIIDRSIPVAFEPGENHNVDRAILVRRFIE
jgi:hypothetical protein